MEYIDDREPGKPFFAYLSYTAPHDPLYVPDEWLEKYKGRNDHGYEALRKDRLDNLKKLGFISDDVVPFPHFPLSPEWESLTDEEKKRETRKMEIYSAMIDNVDYHLARLFNTTATVGHLTF